MDIGIHVRGKIDKEEKERIEKEGDDTAMQILRIQTDLREADKLVESMKALEENWDWQNFQRILIEPALEKVAKEVKRLNEPKELQSNPQALSQLIYNNAFFEVLKIMSDFPAIRKDNVAKQKLLQGRIKELQKGK